MYSLVDVHLKIELFHSIPEENHVRPHFGNKQDALSQTRETHHAHQPGPWTSHVLSLDYITFVDSCVLQLSQLTVVMGLLDRFEVQGVS